LVKNLCRYISGDLKAFYLFFCFDFLHIDPSNDFCFCNFFAKGLKSEGERLKVKCSSLEMVKIGWGQQHYRRCRCRHRLQSFNDEKNDLIRSAMDALRNSKKISLLAVAILFLFTFFNLILDAPRSWPFIGSHVRHQVRMLWCIDGH
jgi:hypothetical protein